MVKFQRLIIMAVILLGFNFKVHAELVVEPNGRVRVSTGGFNQNGVRTWRYLDNGRGGMGGNMFYHETSSKSLAVREASTGLRSVSTVPVTLEAQVSRKAVLSGAFGLVKKGAALGTRLSGWGTAAYFAYEAYQAVKSDLEFEGYKYDEGSNEFLKEWPARNCIWIRDDADRVQDVSCYGVDSSIISAMRKGGKSESEAEFVMQRQMEQLASQFWEQWKKELDKKSDSKFWEYFTLDECRFNLNGGDCLVKRGSDYRSPISFRLKMRDTEVLSQEKFIEIATQSIDGNPTPFVKGTGYPEYNEKVSVPAGTVVTIGPVTPENGKPVQITITFGKDSGGNTTAEVATTQRPDLDPGSPAAPNTKPDPDPNPNPDGKPDKKPDGNPDGKPDKKPDDKPDPDRKDDPKKDERPKEDDKPKEDGGLLCKVFPNILACDELPEKEDPNLEIPQETIDLNFTPDNSFKEYGECPAPVTFQALGTEYKISLEPACNLAAMMRPFIIAMAWLVASFFVARVVRNNA